MTIDRRTTTVPRSWAVSVLMGAFFMVGALVMVGVAMLRQGDDIAEVVQRQRRADQRAEEQTRITTIEARERLSEALAGVRRILEDSIAEHDEVARHNHNAQLARLAELIGRRPPPTIPSRPVPSPAPTASRAGVSPSPPAAPPSTQVASTTARPIPPPPPAKPAPTTATSEPCEAKGKKGKCK